MPLSSPLPWGISSMGETEAGRCPGKLGLQCPIAPNLPSLLWAWARALHPVLSMYVTCSGDPPTAHPTYLGGFPAQLFPSWVRSLSCQEPVEIASQVLRRHKPTAFEHVRNSKRGTSNVVEQHTWTFVFCGLQVALCCRS